MIGKILGALVGGRIAQETSKVGGGAGAAIGAAVPFVLSRLSIPTMIAVGVGGYALKKYVDGKDAAHSADSAKKPIERTTHNKVRR